MSTAERYRRLSRLPAGPLVRSVGPLSTPAGFVLMILGFHLWWPIGSRDPCLHDLEQKHGLLRQRSLQRKMERWKGRWAAWRERNAGLWRRRLSGSPWARRARAASRLRRIPHRLLRRLEEDSASSGDFLDRLRFAKDKSEFDRVHAERPTVRRRRGRRSAAAKLTFPRSRTAFSRAVHSVRGGRPDPFGLPRPPSSTIPRRGLLPSASHRNKALNHNRAVRAGWTGQAP